MRPSQFYKAYLELPVRTETGIQTCAVRRYVSDEPRTKPWVKEAFWDFECFVKRTHRYAPGAGNYTSHHELYGNAFAAPTLLGGGIPVGWKTMSLCFYGKGLPADFANTLSVVAYYLNHAKLPLSYLGWKSAMPLADYAWWYFGLDCNGFAGAYYQTEFPYTGVDGNDHINVLDTMKKMKKRSDFSEMRDGDLMVREGSKGAGKRHVAVIESIYPIDSKKASVIVTQSSSSKGGLSSDPMLLVKLDGSDGDGHGPFLWDLAGYYKFHHALGPR